MKRKWPQSPDPSFAWAEFAVEGQQPPFARALELLDSPVIRSSTGRWPRTVDAYRAVLYARLGSATDRQKAAQLLWKWGRDGTIDPWVGFAQLVLLGDVDGVFRAADLLLTPSSIRRLFGSDIGLGNPYLVLFGPQARDVRRDPRFMPLAQRLGLVDYWRATDRWPDFCSESGLPYDCKVEAAKLAAKASSRPGR
jgi:hypothetical protein